jgi:ABC-type uncharacterized transport system auxiliary subunit
MRLNDCTTIRNLTAPASGLRFANAGAALAVAALLALALSGCGSMKPIKYYQLTHPPTTPLGPSQTPVDIALLVRPFQTSHLYREDRIVYGGEGEQLGLYETHRWIEPPVELLQDALARGLRTSGQFKTVSTLRSDANVDFVLTGHLYAFREISAGSVVARLNFDVQLKDQKLDKVVWRHTYNRDVPSTGKTVADVAAAMDKNVQISVQEIQDGVLQALANSSRK